MKKNLRSKKMKRFVLILILSILFFSVSPLFAADTPDESVKANVDQVLAVLRNKSLGREAKTERLESIYKKMFNEVELSKRSMGRHWKQLNPSQQKEFVDIFRRILEKAYIDKILAYKDEKVEFDKSSMIAQNRAEVPTTVVSSSRRTPITYRLIKQENDWRVYDVVIENVSLVQNYRSQFNELMTKNSPEQLIEILRKKVKQK
jgi:phospholipid transport system substrate-binding protein